MKYPLNWNEFLNKKVIIRSLGHQWIATVISVDEDGKAKLEYHGRILTDLYPPFTFDSVAEFK